MTAIAIIPARGGSKSIPRKNIRNLHGRPLISYIIQTALTVQELGRVIISTDDAEIARIASQSGAEVPFIRPAELAGDEVPTLPVLQHAVRYLEEQEKYFPDMIVLLYPTSPMLAGQRISEGIRMMADGRFDSVISVEEDFGHFWIQKGADYVLLYPEAIANRQYVKPLFRENGALYIVKRDVLMRESSLYGRKTGFITMGKGESVDIDDPVDFDTVQKHLGGER
jgi:CMP-N,N'-diacetyllegionaminic acid synthase